MTYEKPEVVAFGPACEMIQSSGKGPGPNDTAQHKPTAGAYEADE
jgi:hypothetical protein